LNRLDEAATVFRKAEERRLQSETLTTALYTFAFLRGDTAQMAQLLSSTLGNPSAEASLLAAQADTEAWSGKMKAARELTQRAADSAQRNDAKENAAGYQASAALREAASGDREQAIAHAHAALKLSPNRDGRAMAALALALADDTPAAEKLVAALNLEFPLDTLVQKYWIPTIQGAIALGRKDPRHAIDLLQPTSAIELGQPIGAVSLVPVYLRAEAYRMLRDGNAAAREFQKFIDHGGVVGNFPWGALARLGVARAYSLQGDTLKAENAYRNFLSLWKNADADVPIYKAAKAEYAKLHNGS
jgi:tetratricopeptide (TPR) repeat protein